MRIAVLADIHGNSLALEAVLADLDRRAADLIVNLGDCVSGPLWPRETFDRLETLRLPTVRGNHDRQVAFCERTRLAASDAAAFDALEPLQRTRLGALPFSCEFVPGVVGFHATPDNDDRYLLNDIVEGRLVRAASGKIIRRLGNRCTGARLLLLGHSHLADLVRLPDGLTVVNPGSVGCPAYHDPTGIPHVSEAGSPHARYALVELADGAEPRVGFFAVPYAHEEAARRAETNGRPDWAHALGTGYMPGAS